MNREFLINIIFLISVNLLIKPFYIFGIDRTIQNTLPEGEYGLYFTLFGFTFLFQIINDFGIQQYNNRNLSQRPYLFQKYFPKLLVIKLLLNLVFLLFVLVFTLIIYAEEVEIYPLIFYISINNILISLVQFLRSNISGLGLFRTDSLISALEKTLLIIICAVLLWGNLFESPFQLEWFIWAQTASWGLTGLVCFLVLRKYSRDRINTFFKWSQFTFHPRLVISILKQTYPFALVVLLMTIYTRIDSVMIERMLPNGRQQADVYAAAYRLLDAVNVFGVLFAGLLLPMFANLLKKEESVQPLVDLSIKLIWAGAIPLAIGTYFFREEIMFLLYTNATINHGEVLGYLILTFIAVSGIYIYSTLLTANASLKKMNWLFVFSIILNVILNYFLIQKYQATGAAIATLITQFFILFGKMVLSNTEIGIQFNWRLKTQILSFGAFVIFINYQIYYLDYSNWIYKYIIGIVLCFSLAFLFKLIKLSELKTVKIKKT
ncbi:MAG: oligosaccharide flippase family protein [Saprospiraceae bacterium]|jgi:O-antigen/teichoic acid export membrane protein|nr:oligosaccharide flippase family protein [Saprospiraceae bacterium]